MRLHTLVHWLLSCSLLVCLSACGSFISSGGFVEYQPPFAPISFSVNSDGEISTAFQPSINTFLGEFTIGAELAFVQPDEIVVIFRNRREGIEERYVVETGRNVRILANGQTRIEVSADGVVIVDITNGQIDDLTIRAPCVNALAVGCRATAYAMDEGLKIREGPGTQFPILENLPRGATVTIIGSPQYSGGYRWWQVRSDRGNEGWAVDSADGLVTLVPITD